MLPELFNCVTVDFANLVHQSYTSHQHRLMLISYELVYYLYKVFDCIRDVFNCTNSSQTRSLA